MSGVPEGLPEPPRHHVAHEDALGLRGRQAALLRHLQQDVRREGLLQASLGTLRTSGQTETVSVRFRPVSVSVFGFSPFSVFRPNWPILAAHFSIKSTAKTGYFGRKSYLAEIFVSVKISAFPGALFCFRCFGQKSVSFDHFSPGDVSPCRPVGFSACKLYLRG